jgi:hypothetical protein
MRAMMMTDDAGHWGDIVKDAHRRSGNFIPEKDLSGRGAVSLDFFPLIVQNT